MSYTNLNSEPFDKLVSLRDAYRVMYQFIYDLNERGPADTEWILFAYAGVVTDGETQDPAAADDFLAAADAVLNRTD